MEEQERIALKLQLSRKLSEAIYGVALPQLNIEMSY
jgi:hypothetical protein